MSSLGELTMEETADQCTSNMTASQFSLGEREHIDYLCHLSFRSRMRRRLSRCNSTLFDILIIPSLPPQLTNDNSYTDLQDRKRALSKQLCLCLENHTGFDSYTNEILDNEVDYGPIVRLESDYYSHIGNFASNAVHTFILYTVHPETLVSLPVLQILLKYSFSAFIEFIRLYHPPMPSSTLNLDGV
jgi:hypothetical protein